MQPNEVEMPVNGFGRNIVDTEGCARTRETVEGGEQAQQTSGCWEDTNQIVVQIAKACFRDADLTETFTSPLHVKRVLMDALARGLGR